MDDPKPTDGTIDDLKDHLATVDDPAHLEQIRQDEADGKDRAGAHAAIDARAAELNSGDATGEGEPTQNAADETDGNVTGTAGDSAADATHEDGGEPATTTVETPHPEVLTDEQINEASGGGLKESASQQQADVARQMVENREAAQSGEPIERPAHPLAGYGPGADIG